jgi:protein O-GlcNAc transferase
VPGATDLEQSYGQALAALRQGALGIAEQKFKSVLAAQPGHVGALNLLGIVLLRLGKAAEAESCLRQAIGAGPKADPATLHNYAIVLRSLGRSAEALAQLDDALVLEPGDPELWNARGTILNDLGRYQDAAAEFEKAIALRPDLVTAHYNLGNSLALIGHYERALSACDSALALNADFALAWFGRSQMLKVIGSRRESIEAFEKYALLATHRELPRWREVAGLATDLFAFDLVPAIYSDEPEIDAERARLERLIGSIERRLEVLDGLVAPPGVILNAVFCVAGFNIAYQQKNDLDLNRRYAEVLQRILRIERAQLPRALESAKIRFGMASALLKDHNATRWALEWLAQLPYEDYAFFVYALNTDLDETSNKFAALGKFRQLVFNEKTVPQALEVMRGDRLDILMLPDVGMTPASRVLCQFRIAPIQFSAWGHPVTTGSSNIDYYLSGDLMEPADAQSHYSERLIRLPNLALYIKPSSYPVDHKLHFELPSNRVLYGCLQSLLKYLPQFDFVFPRIAARVPDASFLFIEGSPAPTTTPFRDRLRSAFERAGLDFEDRVIFLPRMSAGQFGALLRNIDVAVDSIGWTGGNTTIQSLEANCPVVTLPLDFMRGRHSYAMLKMIGIDELIAQTAAEFVDILVRLGVDREFRASMVQKIAGSKHRLYEDREFIAALDSFLKAEHAAALDRL